MFWDIFKKNKPSVNFVINNFNACVRNYEDLTNEEQEYVNNNVKKIIELMKNISSSKEFDIDNIFEEIKMYQELHINNMFDYALDNITYKEIIKINKLKIYKEELLKIYNKLELEYLTLKRVDTKSLIINKDIFSNILKYNKRKYIIDSYIEQIVYNLEIINSLIKVIDYEINSFMKKYSNDKNIKMLSNDFESDYLIVKNNYKYIYNKEIDENNPLVNYSLMEIELERYCYNNKEKVNLIREELDNISNLVINSEEEQNKIIDRLLNLKKELIIFSNYSRNIITEEDFKIIFALIFNVYNYYQNNDKFCDYIRILGYYKLITLSYPSKYLEMENKYYQRIIEYKIYNLLNKKSNIFSYLNNDEVYNILVSALKEREYSSDIILKNGFKYNLLMSLDKEDGLKDFINNYEIDFNLDSNEFLSYSYYHGIYKVIDVCKFFSIYKPKDHSYYYNFSKILPLIFNTDEINYNQISKMFGDYPYILKNNFKNVLNLVDKNKPIILPNNLDIFFLDFHNILNLDYIPIIDVSANTSVQINRPNVSLEKNIKGNNEKKCTFLVSIDTSIDILNKEFGVFGKIELFIKIDKLYRKEKLQHYVNQFSDYLVTAISRFGYINEENKKSSIDLYGLFNYEEKRKLINSFINDCSKEYTYNDNTKTKTKIR